jgi:hypothetical protein
MSAVNIDGPRACTKRELPTAIELVDTAMREGNRSDDPHRLSVGLSGRQS